MARFRFFCRGCGKVIRVLGSNFVQARERLTLAHGWTYLGPDTTQRTHDPYYCPDCAKRVCPHGCCCGDDE